MKKDFDKLSQNIIFEGKLRNTHDGTFTKAY